MKLESKTRTNTVEEIYDLGEFFDKYYQLKILIDLEDSNKNKVEFLSGYMKMEKDYDNCHIGVYGANYKYKAVKGDTETELFLPKTSALKLLELLQDLKDRGLLEDKEE